MRPPFADKAIIERPSALPVTGLNFDNKKELNKQLAKLDQDLRNAIAQNDGGAIQRFTQKQQAANDVLKAMKAGYSASEAQDFAAREAEIRQAQQRYPNPAPQAARQTQDIPTMPAPAPATPATSPLNTLAKTAASGGSAGQDAKAALTQRAAAGDPQAANILKNLNSTKNGEPSEYIPAGKPVPGKPGSVADGKGGWSYPNQGNSEREPSDSKAAEPTLKRPASGENNPSTIQNHRTILPAAQPKKEPTAEEMAAQIDKQNRAREMAAQAAAQREAARKAAEIQAARDAAARKMGFPNAAEAERLGAKIGNPGEKLPRGGGGGGGRGGGRGPQMTAKERNMAADEAASKAARRADSRGYSDSAYRDANKASRQWGENEDARRARLEKSGLNPDYNDWDKNPEYRKDVEDANKRYWDNFNNTQKEREKQAARKAAADNYKKAMQEGTFTDANGDIKQSKNPDGSASEDLINWSQNQRPAGSSSGTWRTIDGRKVRIS